MRDPTSFRSALLPTEHFDRRFSPENVAFWVPLLVSEGRISSDTEVLDVGCGTGGFAREIARLTSARVTGCDQAEQFIEFARATPEPEAGAVAWAIGDAEELPFEASSFDRVLLSLVLHQPRIDTIAAWLERAGFVDVAITRHIRNKPLDPDEEERGLEAEVEARYSFVSKTEVEDGVRRMREEAERCRGNWVDPRPTYVIVAAKPS